MDYTRILCGRQFISINRLRLFLRRIHSEIIRKRSNNGIIIPSLSRHYLLRFKTLKHSYKRIWLSQNIRFWTLQNPNRYDQQFYTRRKERYPLLYGSGIISRRWCSFILVGSLGFWNTPLRISYWKATLCIYLIY